MSRLRESPGHERGAGEAGRHAVVALAHQLREPVARAFAERSIQKVEADRQRVDGGAVRDDAPVLGDIVLVEGLAGAVGEA